MHFHPPAWFALYPYGGGGVGSFGPLAALLGAAHVHVPEYPGRDRRFREPGHLSFADLADDAWNQLRRDLRTHPGSSLVLFGYSLGAMVATEMAIRLEAEGTTPRALVVAGAAAPSTWRTHGLTGLSEDEYVDRLKALGIAPAELLDDPAMRLHLMPVWLADTRVAESIPGRDVRLNCPVHAIAGNRDPLVNEADLTAWLAVGNPASTTNVLGGDHGTLIHHPVALARSLVRAGLHRTPAAATRPEAAA